MVTKLFKHEVAALGRVLLPVQGILLGIAVLCRVLQLFEWDHAIYDIVFGSSVFFLVVANLVSLFMVTAMGVVRFYKNLFTAEGYLSFTLPVTPAQHIFVKFTAAFLFQVIGICVSLLSVCIATAGEVLVELLKAAHYLLNELFKVVGEHLFLYLLEIILLVSVSFICGMLLYYTCIAIGQLARKNRILAAVGVYFGYYAVSQVIGTVMSVLLSVFYELLPFEAISNFIEQHPIGFVHILLCGGIILSLIMAGIYFFITHIIIRKRLNLE